MHESCYCYLYMKHKLNRINHRDKIESHTRYKNAWAHTFPSQIQQFPPSNFSVITIGAPKNTEHCFKSMVVSSGFTHGENGRWGVLG